MSRSGDEFGGVRRGGDGGLGLGVADDQGGQQAAAGYDHLTESYAAPLPDPAEVRDTKFANGLDVILDGLALRLPR